MKSVFHASAKSNCCLNKSCQLLPLGAGTSHLESIFHLNQKSDPGRDSNYQILALIPYSVSDSLWACPGVPALLLDLFPDDTGKPLQPQELALKLI